MCESCPGWGLNLYGSRFLRDHRPRTLFRHRYRTLFRSPPVFCYVSQPKLYSVSSTTSFVICFATDSVACSVSPPSTCPVSHPVCTLFHHRFCTMFRSATDCVLCFATCCVPCCATDFVSCFIYRRLTSIVGRAWLAGMQRLHMADWHGMVTHCWLAFDFVTFQSLFDSAGSIQSPVHCCGWVMECTGAYHVLQCMLMVFPNQADSL